MVVIIRSNNSMKCKNRITCCEIFVFVLLFVLAKVLSILEPGGGRSLTLSPHYITSIITAAVESGQRVGSVVALAVNVECLT